MNRVKIDVEPRDTGKKAARSVRRQGHVPCVLYGRGEDNVHFQMEQLELNRLVFTKDLYRVELALNSDSYDCILKDVDFDPLTDRPIHADFQLLQEGEKLQVTMPVRFIGKAKGMLEGGEVQLLVHELQVVCLPKDIPDAIEIDISDLEIGQTIHVSDLDLPDVEILSSPGRSLVTITVRREEILEPEEEEEVLELEGEEALEGEEVEGEDLEEEEEAVRQEGEE